MTLSGSSDSEPTVTVELTHGEGVMSNSEQSDSEGYYGEMSVLVQIDAPPGLTEAQIAERIAGALFEVDYVFAAHVDTSTFMRD